MTRTSLLAPRPGARIDLGEGDPAHGVPVQPSLDDLGEPLHEVTFVVVDLETTGGSPSASEITEIGAVKVRGGEVLGEFGTLVDPGVAIPPKITVLTGITTAMVQAAPRIGQVLPSFLEFLGGAVLVAHNAPFDVGFLRENARRLELRWPAPRVVDTVRLARRVVTRDEAPNYKLASLARLFGSSTEPNHRALQDARATVDVLHGLLARMASLGVGHLEDLATAADPVPPARRRRVTLADHLPRSPGVYSFIGPSEQVLYVGTATNLRTRVRQYFTASEKRRRIGEMVDLAVRVDAITCPTALEAQVRELRLIASHDPPYNRRSRRPDRAPWVRLTDEPHPRLSIVRSVPAEAAAVGPFTSRRAAQLAVEAIQQAVPLRRCTRALPLRPRTSTGDCVLGQIGRCSAPCIDPEAAASYEGTVSQARAAITGTSTVVVRSAVERIAELTLSRRYEEAGDQRARVESFARTLSRQRALEGVQGARRVVAARAHEGGWQIVDVRYGRLAGTAHSACGHPPMATVQMLADCGEAVPEPDRPGGAASVEETALLTSWLGAAGTRLIEFDHPTEQGWSIPIGARPVDLRTHLAALREHDGAGRPDHEPGDPTDSVVHPGTGMGAAR